MWKKGALLGFFVIAGAGCGADVEASCLDACEKGNECAETPQDCKETCDEGVKAAERTGCESETASFYDCLASDAECGEDIGFGSDVCQAEFGDVLSCVLDYCSENPSAEDCFSVDDD